MSILKAKDSAGHGSLVGRANVMLQGTSISNLIASVFTDTSSMLVGSPLMDNAVGQMRSTFMQCRAERAHANPHGSPFGEKKLNGPRIYDKIRAVCSEQEGCNLVGSSLVRQQRIGAVAFSLSLVAP